VRVAQLAEVVAILRAMWTQDEATYQGEYFTVEGAVCVPRPVQEGGPPLWIAGGGERATLRVVAEHADYANYFGDVERFHRRTAALRQQCRDVGREFDDITLTRNIDCLIAADEAILAEKAEEWIRRSPWHDSIEQFAAVGLYGTPEQMVTQVEAQVGLGYGVLLVEFVDATWGDGMRVFGEHIIPAFA
jgi:alkanesulfonate monooxygenase SsuD/methylene tetrahydromethanopterin reductase-like flavin-dependent oxidoreductase (luciferase family)